jgi:FkbM family methyltransferase
MNIIKKIIRYIFNKFKLEFKLEKYYEPIYIDSKQAGNGLQMELYFRIIKTHCDFEIENFFEVGANYCQDSMFVKKHINVPEKNIYCFEPNPNIYKTIKNNKFNTYDIALSDREESLLFNITNTNDNENSGISSLKRNKTHGVIIKEKVIVKTTTLKKFMLKNNIKIIDFLKIDAEGNDYEVIKGIGDKIENVKIIQVETARKKIFEGEKIFDELNRYMYNSKFSLVYYRLSSDNVSGDALYINDRFLNDKKEYS